MVTGGWWLVTELRLCGPSVLRQLTVFMCAYGDYCDYSPCPRHQLDPGLWTRTHLRLQLTTDRSPLLLLPYEDLSIPHLVKWMSILRESSRTLELRNESGYLLTFVTQVPHQRFQLN